MLVVGVTRFRAKLSEYVTATKAGEVVLIAERGKPIALMIPEGLDPGERERLLQAAREGFRVLPESGQLILSCCHRPPPTT